MELVACKACLTPFDPKPIRGQPRRYCSACGGGRSNSGAAKKIRHLLHRYGISYVDYLELVAAAGGCCQACGSPPESEGSASRTSLHVDHDHETGEIRGLLCYRCNLALGYVQESPARLQGLIDYLGKMSSQKLG